MQHFPFSAFNDGIYMQKGKRYVQTGEKILGNREKVIGLLVAAARIYAGGRQNPIFIP